MPRSFYILAAAVLLAGCDALGLGDDPALLSGTVVNASTSRPIAGATVQINEYDIEVETDSVGAFTLEVDIDSVDVVEIFAFKTGFESDQAFVTVDEGQALTVPALTLFPSSGANGPSGPATSITLAPRSSEAIGVSEAGSQETATLVFVALDADGRPVDVANAVDISAEIINGPDGGEFLSPAPPEAVRTDENGEATVTLTSGTAAGVVQVEARATVNGREIRSRPITLVINGGFPNQNHFTVATDALNYASFNILGNTVSVTALVGDQYANPVQLGTQVYFTTNMGVIGGSSPTDGQGVARVTLLTGNPFPSDGVGTITARTSGINGEDIEVTTSILITGRPLLTLFTPGLELGSYEYSVRDANGNPMSEGTSITVTVEGENIVTRGETAVTLGDIVRTGIGATDFTFVIAEDDPTADTPARVDEIRIEVNGPNGTVSASRPGNLGPGVIVAGRQRQ
ncbi:MAG: invasin domain 3-containing protein [Bacteroidota bacterium]